MQSVPRRHETMKKLFALVVLSLSISLPSYGAEHVVSHSAKVAGKDSYKAATYSAKGVGKAGKAIWKFAF
jgi:hypothetical protein